MADATVLYINQQASDLFLVPIDQALGKKAPDYYVHPKQREQMVNIIKQRGFVTDFEVEIKNDFGYRFWALVSAQELIYNNEACILVGINNINERKEIETQLRISENNYRDLFEKNPLPMWVYDLHTLEFLNVNNAAILHYSYSKEEFLSMTIKDIRPKEELDRLKKHVAQKFSGLLNAGTFIHKKKDGTLIQVDVTAYPVVFNGRSSNLILAHDITERLIADEKLKANEELLQSINANIREGLYRSTPESGIIYVNEAFSEMFGYDSVEDVLRTPSPMLYDNPERREQLKKKIANKGHFTNEEVLFLRKDGSKFWALVSSISSTDKDGNLYYDGAIKDITDRKQAEEKLIYSETLLKNIFNESTDALFLADAEKREILTCNNQAIDLFDATSEQVLIGKNTQIFRKHKISDRERDEIKGILDERGVWTREIEYVSLKGKNFWGSVAVKRIKIGSIIYDLVRITDTTERKKAEEKLIYNETLLKNIFNESTDALFLLEAKDRLIISCNRRAIELFEAANENGLIGTPGHSMRKNVLDRRELAGFSKFLDENSFWTGEVVYLTKKGNEFLANVAVQRIVVGAKSYELVRITDITELKRSEEKIKNSLQEKEILLEEIHHRVKNNLAVISGLLYLQAEYVKDSSTKVLLNESQNRIRSMALIHEKLYQSSTLSKIDFGEYAVGLIEQIKYAYPMRDKKVEVEVVSKDIFLEIAHAVPCGLILNELVSNAYKYAFTGKSEGLISITFTKEAEGFVLKVADNGVGIKLEQDLEELTSLGLTLVYALVSQLKGKLEIKNDGGTAFIIKFI